jgi:ABC-type sugar transport system ATPase subunit
MVMVRLDHVTTRFDPIHYRPRSEFSPLGRPDTPPPARAPGRGGDDARAEPAQGAKVLDDLSLTILPGETLSVVGPSGCGKSTLLRVIAGLIEPASGEVYFDGQPMRGVPPRARGIGMVFQNYALYPHMAAADNVGFFWRLRRRPRPEISERVRQTAQILGVGFEALLGRLPRHLSGGEQQRVAVGRCIVREPSVFLLDEPFSNLDAHLRERSRREVKRLLQRFGVTTVFVTHDQHEALAMGDRLAVMRAGTIVQIGPYQELYADPHDSFVAGFLGDPPISLWACRYRADLDRLELGVQVAVEMAGASRLLDDGQAVLLGARAEAVALTAPQEAGAAVARVTHCEPRFAERLKIVYFELAGQQGAAKVPFETPVRVGDRVGVRLDSAQLLVFDALTHRRLYLPHQARA